MVIYPLLISLLLTFLNFVVEHTGLSTAGAFTVDYSITDNTTTAGSDYTGALNGTLNFNGTTGDTETISLVVNDDTLYEFASETFTIQLSTSSDPTVEITDIATGTINDNEVILNNSDLILTEELDGYFGYTSTGGSLRTQSNSGDTCAITTSSSNTLTSSIPVGATIKKAILYWAHSGATPDVQVTFEGNTVNADLVYAASEGTGFPVLLLILRRPIAPIQ